MTRGTRLSGAKERPTSEMEVEINTVTIEIDEARRSLRGTPSRLTFAGEDPQEIGDEAGPPLPSRCLPPSGTVVEPGLQPAIWTRKSLSWTLRKIMSSLSWTLRRILLGLWDVGAWTFALFLAAALRFDLDIYAVESISLLRIVAVAVVAQLAVGGILAIYGGRHCAGSLDDAANVTASVMLAGTVAFIACLQYDPQSVPRSVPLLALPIALVVTVGARLTYRLHRERHPQPHLDPIQRVIIFGAGEPGQRLLRSMLSDGASRYLPVALLDDDPGLSRRRILGVAVRGTRADIATTAWKSGADLLVIAGQPVDAPTTREISAVARLAGLEVRVVPPLEEMLLTPPRWLDRQDPDAAGVAQSAGSSGIVDSRAKRFFDITMCVLSLPLVLPIVVVVAMVLKFTGDGEIVYRAPRVGRNMQTFTMFKFCGMRRDDTGPRVTQSGDPRITPVGRVLRATKLDELPQIFNVLKGEMSIVGPRPEDPRYAALYTEEQRRVLLVRPGMTCMSYLRYGNEQAYIERARPVDIEKYYVTKLLPEKLDIELQYVRDRTMRTDLMIIARTFVGIVT